MQQRLNGWPASHYPTSSLPTLRLSSVSLDYDDDDSDDNGGDDILEGEERTVGQIVVRWHGMNKWIPVKYFTQKNWRADICKTQFLPSNLNFTLKTVLLSNAILSFFFLAWSLFSSFKRSLLNEAVFNLFYIFCNFGPIFCTKVILFFSGPSLYFHPTKDCCSTMP